MNHRTAILGALSRSNAFAISRGHSERGACELIGISRSMLNYQSVRAERDAPVIAAMKRLGAPVPALRLPAHSVLPETKGYSTSWQPAHRLWKAAGLQLPRRRPVHWVKLVQKISDTADST